VNEDETELLYDDLGNALGGVRTPYVDAPVATLSGFGQTGSSFCSIFGTTDLFDEATLAMLYPSRDHYIAARRQTRRSRRDSYAPSTAI
jgi:hypothetical protein